MSCYNYSMCKKASVSFTPPTQGNFNPGQRPYTPKPDAVSAIAGAWDKPTPNQPAKQNQNNSNSNNDYANGMLTGGLLGAVAGIGGAGFAINNKLRDIGGVKGAMKLYNTWNSLNPDSKKFIKGAIKNGGNGDLNKQIAAIRNVKENPVRAGLRIAVKGIWDNITGLFS